MAFVNQLTRRGFASSVRLAKIHEVIIVGGGLMGAGIAQVIADWPHLPPLRNPAPFLLIIPLFSISFSLFIAIFIQCIGSA